jgi:alanine racemase
MAAQGAGVDYLAVAHLQEGIALREAGVVLPILVLGAIHEDQVEAILQYNLEPTVSSIFKADLLTAGCAKNKKRCRVHLEVDTGMQRTGVRPATAKSLFDYLQKAGCFDVVGIYSHLATADNADNSFTYKQLEIFNTLLSEAPVHGEPLIRHIANSGGTLNFLASHLDMVRPALLTFGYYEGIVPASLADIFPCFSLKSKVSYFKVVEKGEGVSYGHSYITPKQTRIVTVPVGYGDGYRRSLSNKGSVLIRGKRFPIIGTICMDQFMVDIGDNEVHVGDEVVLIGKQGREEIPLQEIAKLCDTIPYEILCLFNDRIPRLYTASSSKLEFWAGSSIY